MRIGIDYTSAVRQQAGIGRYTRELVGALLTQDSRHEYTLFAATGGLTEARWSQEIEHLRADRSDRLRIRSLPLSDDWLARVWHRLRLPIPVELVTGPLDVFYSPDFALPPTRSGTRALLTVHDLSFLRHPDVFVPALRRYLERVVPHSISRADVVLADSAHTRADLIDLLGLPGDRVRVVHPGVDARFQPQEGLKSPSSQEERRTLPASLRRRYEIPDAPYVLSVGTLQPRKNYLRLIRAFVRMGATGRGDLQLLIAGSPGWLCEDVVGEASEHEQVHLLGFVEDEDLPALYQGASLFAFPSLYEGFGLPVLEAMACGVPVVCSSTSSLPEVAGDAALLIDPLDEDKLSMAMEHVLKDDELRRKMIDRGLARALRFTWTEAATKLLNLINSWEKR